MGYASQAWSELDSAQRAAWDALAIAHPVPTRLDNTVYLNGFNLYQRIFKIQLTYLPFTTPDAPPVYEAFSRTFAPTLENDGADLIFSANPSDTSSTWNVLIYLSPPHSPTQVARRNQLRYIQYDSINFVNNISVLAAYVAAFGKVPQVGETVSVMLCTTNGGQAYYTVPINIVVI